MFLNHGSGRLESSKAERWKVNPPLSQHELNNIWSVEYFCVMRYLNG